MLRLLLILAFMVSCVHTKPEKVYTCEALNIKLGESLESKGYTFQDIEKHEHGIYAFFLSPTKRKVLFYHADIPEITTKSIKAELKASDIKASVRKGNLCVSETKTTYRIHYITIAIDLTEGLIH
jgi:hypothetical protein